MNYFYAILLLFTIVVCLSIIYYTIKNRISPYSTSTIVKQEVLNHVNVFKPKNIVDLGAGFGSIAFSFAKANPFSSVTAIENSFIPVLYMHLKQKILKLPNLKIKYKNMYDEPLNSYDLVYCFLFTSAMQTLNKESFPFLEKNSCIISNTFSIYDQQAEQVIQVDDRHKTKVYIYIM